MQTSRKTSLQPEKYIVVAHMPSCSAVLFVNPSLDPPQRVTILLEDTAAYCVAWAAGFRAASGLDRVQHLGSIYLPAGNPAQSFERRMTA